MQSAFLVVPTQDPTGDPDWDLLDRAARMKLMRSRLAELGTKIRSRVQGCELQYLEGLGGWTLRTGTEQAPEDVAEKLRDLPVEVAPDDRFYAL